MTAGRRRAAAPGRLGRGAQAAAPRCASALGSGILRLRVLRLRILRLACAATSVWAVLGAAPALALSADHDLRGYLKDTPLLQRADGGTEWLDTARLRLTGRWYAGPRWTLAADADLMASTGSRLDAPGVRAGLRAAARDDGWVDMTWVLADEDHLWARHRVDRLFAEYYGDRFVATVGRQRVAWGVSEVFRPLDRFAPFAPADIDTEERAGIDAARLSLPWGRLSNLEAVYSPGTGGAERQRLGLRLRSHVGQADVSAVLGRFDGATATGGALALSLHGAAVRAEALWLEPGAASRVQATLGATYGLSWRNLTLSGEVHRDGTGATRRNGYDWLGLAAGRRLTLARHYATATVSALAQPLVTLSLTGIVNADDGSWVAWPQLRWDAGGNREVTAGVQAFGGDRRSELGSRDGQGFAILAWYF